MREADRLARAVVTLRYPRAWGAVDGAWVGAKAQDLAPDDDPRHGAIGAHPRWEHPPGLDPSQPISASRLGMLLQCPHRFFATQGLCWSDAAVAPEPSEVSAIDFGNAMHRCAERFFNEHGARFESRVGEVGDYLSLAGPSVDAVWGELRDELVLENDAWIVEHARAREHFGLFLEHEWSRPAGRWIAAERPFGYEPDPAVRVETPTGPMWLRGDIDRLRHATGEDGEPVVEV